MFLAEYSVEVRWGIVILVCVCVCVLFPRQTVITVLFSRIAINLFVIHVILGSHLTLSVRLPPPALPSYSICKLGWPSVADFVYVDIYREEQPSQTEEQSVIISNFSRRFYKGILLVWGTLVKVLCYISEGRWFDPRWCH